MAAGNIRTIQRQIRSVQNIKKITRAMQMVSAAKLRKVQERLMAIRPYADKIAELLEHLSSAGDSVDHVLFRPHESVKKVAYVVMMADKGLCGSYNANMARYADTRLKKDDLPHIAVTIGRKADDFLKKSGSEIVETHQQIPTEVPFQDVQAMTRTLVQRFMEGEVDEVHLLFTRYVNAMTFQPGSFRLLPIEPPDTDGKPEPERDYIFEPAPEEILSDLVPRYLEVTFHRLLLESFSSEHAARMNAMQNATKSANDLIESLTLIYNKARQSGITKELLDIVGGAEALTG